MNKLFTLLTINIFFFHLNAQTFRMDYNVALIDLPGNVIEDTKSNQYVFAGSNINILVNVGTIAKIDVSGSLLWSKRYSDASFSFELNDIKKDVGLNEYYLCGGSSSGAALVMRTDTSGNVVVSKRFSISQAPGAYFNRMIKTSDGGYLAVGAVTGHNPGGGEKNLLPITYDDGSGDADCPGTDYIDSPLIVKFDANLNHIWHKVFRYYIGSVAPANGIYNDGNLSDVVEVSDGYIAVGEYEVQNIGSNYNSDCDDVTASDATIIKFTTAGAVTFHKQIDAINTSATQTSNSLNAISKTSTGLPIIAGNVGSKINVLKLAASGGWAAPALNRNITYPGFIVATEPSQIYEVAGSTDLVVMAFYLNFLTFTNVIHRFNATATAKTFAKYYPFTLGAIFPRGQQTADGGWIAMSGIFDYQIIRTDASGNISAACVPTEFNPTYAAGPGTFGDPLNLAFTGTVSNAAIALTVANISPTRSVQCITPLPVELLSFNGKNNKGINTLNWVTGKEISNDHFVIERASNIDSWEAIGIIQSVGNSDSKVEYTFEDHNYNKTINYYRLKQIDYDGKVEYFSPILIDNSSSKKLLKITDILGREIDENYIGIQIHYFDDGSSEKVSK